jgi:hypothetical protein
MLGKKNQKETNISTVSDGNFEESRQVVLGRNWGSSNGVHKAIFV